jgi:hypothetical protein
VVPNERAVLDAVLRWTRARQPAVVPDELLRRIRFPLLLNRPATGSEIESLLLGTPELRMSQKAIVVETFSQYRLTELSQVKRAEFDGQASLESVIDGTLCSSLTLRNPQLNWLHFSDVKSLEERKGILLQVERLVRRTPSDSNLAWQGPDFHRGLLFFTRASVFSGYRLSIAFRNPRIAALVWEGLAYPFSSAVSLPSTVPPLPVTSAHFRTRLGFGPSSIAMIGGDAKSGRAEYIEVARLCLDQYDKDVTTNSVAPLGVRLQMARSAICAVTVQLSASRAFYVIGGTRAGRTVDTVECFVEGRQQLGSWAVGSCAPLPDRRAKAGAAVIGTNIYVVGGKRSTVSLSTVTVHDAGKPLDGWSMRAPLQTAREACGVAALGGYLYAIGGANNVDGQLDSVERYNPSTDTWSFVAR